MPEFRANSEEGVNIILSGVGGQGVLLASDIIVEVAMNNGIDAKKSEVHGMAQRGGSVISQVRYGEKIYSPLITEGKGDILIAFEKLEALRYLHFMKADGVIIYNTQQITPLSVYFSKMEYPGNISEICAEKVQHVFPVDATVTAETLGNLKILNTIMMGALSNLLEFTTESWLDVISNRVPKKTIELNRNAFISGRKLGLHEND
ncbi:MAG: indolepyruvate oxidoreductase subunit beta [candidate division KSB1 bacterium]|jgi:indolepyruvate ferredoxin oxidoreductase beta subunit|nr:indolepyruvate oxidoreductase subunit beta [candidate division KSB1 bacterium]